MEATKLSDATGQRRGSGGSIDDYHVVAKIGEGAFGVSFVTIRELKNLNLLQSCNSTVRLLDVVFAQGQLTMVLEYFEYDLAGLLLSKHNFTMPQIKCYFHQLITAVAQIHALSLMHRDIKPNVLINAEGVLKLADFGLMTTFGDDSEDDKKHNKRAHSVNVVTLWYRSPELLCGRTVYGCEVDIWSTGCILAEMLLQRTPFPGSNETNQLELIFAVCGTPAMEELPEWYQLQLPFKKLPSSLAKLVKELDTEGVDLLQRLLALNSKSRISAKAALAHAFFETPPKACAKTELPAYPSIHEYEAKRKRQELKVDMEKRSKTEKDDSGVTGSLPSPLLATAPLPVPALAPTPHRTALTQPSHARSVSSSQLPSAPAFIPLEQARPHDVPVEPHADVHRYQYQHQREHPHHAREQGRGGGYAPHRGRTESPPLAPAPSRSASYTSSNNNNSNSNSSAYTRESDKRRDVSGVGGGYQHSAHRWEGSSVDEAIYGHHGRHYARQPPPPPVPSYYASPPPPPYHSYAPPPPLPPSPYAPLPRHVYGHAHGMDSYVPGVRSGGAGGAGSPPRGGMSPRPYESRPRYSEHDTYVPLPPRRPLPARDDAWEDARDDRWAGTRANGNYHPDRRQYRR